MTVKDPDNSRVTGLCEPREPWVTDLLAVIAVVATLCTLGWLVRAARFGIDFTDEGHYLVWIANPGQYKTSITQFGFMYHPLYVLLDGDVARIRAANILITFLLGWVLGNTIFREYFQDAFRLRRHRLAVTASFATVALIVFDGWLLTPNYNTLTIQALMIVGIGANLVPADRTERARLAFTLVGFGLWLTFMAKPTSALAVGFFLSVYFFTTRRATWRAIGWISGTALASFLAGAILIDGSIVQFVRRLSNDSKVSDKLDTTHTLAKSFRLGEWVLNDRERNLILVLALLAIGGALSVASKRHAARAAGVIGAALFAGVVISVCLGWTHRNLDIGPYKGRLILAVPLGLVASTALWERRQWLTTVKKSNWAVGIFLVLVPYSFAFGTGNNYWFTASSAGIFWILAFVVFVGGGIATRDRSIALFPMALCAQAIVVALLLTGTENPYRQPQPLRNFSGALATGHGDGHLTVDAGFATYVSNARSGASAAGFVDGTPVLDLTGQSPTLLYLLGAKSVGRSWIIGGYDGSVAVAEEILRQTPCTEIARAWILEEPGGPRSISPKVLAAAGANESDHFVEVASWGVAAGAGGFDSRPPQRLLRPTRTETAAVVACERARSVTSGP